MLYLTDSDVSQLLTPELAADSIEKAFRSLGKGSAAIQERVRTVTPAGKLSTIGGVIPDDDRAGAKVYPTTTDGRFGFVVLLFELSSGEPLAMIRGPALTEIRTAATSVVAARYLAPPDPKVLVLFGAGRQAISHARAFACQFDLAEIRVVHRRPADEVVGRIEQTTGVPTVQLGIERLGLDDADLIVTATRSTEALFDGSRLPRDCHITAVGATTPQSRELDNETLNRAGTIVVESIKQARTEAGDLLLADERVWEKVIELAGVISASAQRPQGVTLFKSLGVGLEDVAVADAIYRVARQKSFGSFLEA
ncbi:MAG TPA: ornithine cyclodeaminase family protein [Acidimicrobiia bacterium]|nr:ornithine cyclodeaminase family protein [Acidimicrobiia bacterium]